MQRKTVSKQLKWQLLWPILLTLAIPLIVAWFIYPTHLPPGFGEFPPQFVENAPGFSLTYFLVMLASVLYIGGLLLFPQYFGFKGAPVIPRKKSKASLPWWFWAGGIVMGFFWWLMWSRVTPFGDLVFWAFTPLWWGFIFFLDGIIYQRNNGASLFSEKPKTLFICGIISILGWVYFEYYDYFVLGNWYYPNAEHVPWSKTKLTIEFLITYSTVTPVLFQWFNLLNTCPKMTTRYQNGPKLNLNGNTMILIGSLLIAAMVYWPYELFWAVWIGPYAVMTGILMRLNIWNPFTDIAKGNWTAGILIGISSLLNGLFWEMWNYGSSHPNAEPMTNPNYWVYDIPYVNVIHLFSEMPLLGYFGYIPFGVLVWQVFIWSGKFFGFDSEILIKAKPISTNSLSN